MRRIRILCAVTAAVAATIASPGASAWAFTSADDFSRENFAFGSDDVTNPYLPLSPGVRYTYDGVVKEAGQTSRHRVVTTITDLVKVVNGVRTRVLWDVDLDEEGAIQEEEIAFHAQDRDGSVWNFGEYPELHEDGEFLGAPDSWLAGVRRSRAGVIMQADPKTGTPWYSQGLAPSVGFDDRGKVIRTGQHVKVGWRVYSGVVVVDETSPSQPGDGHQLKYHAPGMGVVRIEARGGDAQETLTLVKAERLGAKEMAKARKRVITLDKRAYRVAGKVWADSSPVFRPVVARAGKGGAGGSGPGGGDGGRGGDAAVCAEACRP